MAQTFSAPVTYVQPDFEELKRRFQGHVNPGYGHDGRSWFDPSDRYEYVSRENREVAFEYVHMGINHTSFGDVIKEMQKRGLRPALYEELLCFAEKYPDEQRKYPIVALGSKVCMAGCCIIVPSLVDDRGARGLDAWWIAYGFRDTARFLAVRE